MQLSTTFGVRGKVDETGVGAHANAVDGPLHGLREAVRHAGLVVAARPQSNRNRDGVGLSNVENAFWQPLLAATASTFVEVRILRKDSSSSSLNPPSRRAAEPRCWVFARPGGCASRGLSASLAHAFGLIKVP